MRMDKIVWRAIISTAIAMTILFGVMLLALCFIFPSTMMNITYDLGMDASSINNARRAYKTTDEVYYIAFATEVAIGANDYEEIERCGDVLIIDAKFDSYCQSKDKELQTGMSYKQYIYGQVCTAKYQRGKKQTSVSRAFALIGDAFPENNAVVALLFTAIKKGDSETVEDIGGRMAELETTVAEADKAYLQEIRALIDSGITE